MNDFPNIDPKKNYRRLQTDQVFTGRQILNLLKIANKAMQAIILLGLAETDEPATNPSSDYGL